MQIPFTGSADSRWWAPRGLAREAESRAAYRAYGLTIESCVPLNLDGGSGAPDVVIRIERLPHIGPPVAPQSGSLFAGGSPEIVALRVPGRLAAEVRRGREIVLDPALGVDPKLVGEYVLQPMLGYVLQQRGHLVLHASCVEVGGRAIAIVGFSGQGKSTTAAALLGRGHPLLCDDVVPVTAEHRVVPGVLRLGLRPDAAAALGHDLAGIQPCMGGSQKRRYRLSMHAPAGPIPLHRVYILATGSFAIERIGATEALPELVRHTYGLPAIGPGGRQTAHFAQLVGLMRTGVVHRLTRLLDLESLPRLARAIEEDVIGTSGVPLGG